MVRTHWLRRHSLIVIAAVAMLFGAQVVVASTTDGTIDSTNKYAWGSRIGWVNFGNAGGNVHVTDAGLTGYAWSANYGWINLDPTGSGVTNNAEGDLSGQAWGENLGYIDFSNVSINSSGVFTGSASGTSVGQINFDCTNCSVITDWRPASVRAGGGGGDSGGSGGSGGGGTGGGTGYGGGGGGAAVPATLGVTVNNNALTTLSADVTLQLSYDVSVMDMMVSHFSDFRDGVREPVNVSKSWNLCSMVLGASCGDGVYAVYVRFYNSNSIYGPYTDSIFKGNLPLPPPPPQPPAPPVVPPDGGFWDDVGDILGPLIPDFLGPDEPEPVEEPIISLETPDAFKSIWNLLPEQEINRFVFAPLPSDFALLIEKFPELERLSNEVGVKRAGDLRKLYGVTLALPGLPDMSSNRIPTEIVFARDGEDKINLGLGVRLNSKGESEQQIHALANSIVKLVVRPEYPAQRVSGYLAFTSRNGKATSFEPQSITSQLGMISGSDRLGIVTGLASIVETLLGQSTMPNTEERFTLDEFQYTDPDQDGLYTATIKAPPVDGVYSIYTIITYQDPNRPSREIKLTAVIDPEGYVYEVIGGKEARIPEAIATLHMLNRETNLYEPWKATDFAQVNPQQTDARGTYAFLVPPGQYYLTVEASGYEPYQGAPFDVTLGGNGIHTNVRMTTKYGSLKAIDWKTILLLFLTGAVAYTLHRDRRRRLDARTGIG